MRITLSCNSFVFCNSCSKPRLSLSTFDKSKSLPSSDNIDCVITSSPIRLIKLSTLSTPTLIEPTSALGLVVLTVAAAGLTFSSGSIVLAIGGADSSA